MSDAPPAVPAAPAAPAALAPPVEPVETDWKAEARKWEDRAKAAATKATANAAAAKELEQVKQASMSDIEKAVAVARTEATTEALRTVGARLVDAEVRVAAAGRTVDVDALLEGLDRSRFVGDDGEPDRKAIAAWVDRIAPKPAEGAPAFPDLGQGARNVSNAALNGDPLLASLKSAVGAR